MTNTRIGYSTDRFLLDGGVQIQPANPRIMRVPAIRKAVKIRTCSEAFIVVSLRTKPVN